MKQWIGGVLLGLTACIPAPEFTDAALCDKGTYTGVFVLNEGIWTQNNSTLSYYDENQDFASCPDVFAAVNQTPLGDTGNSYLLDSDTLYLIINQSAIVYKLLMPELRLLGELRLPAGASPRQMVKASPSRAYLTSLTDGQLYRFDPRSMELAGEPLAVENYMEGLVIAGDRLFVACGNYAFPAANNKVAVIDLQTDSLLQYIELPEENPGEILQVGTSLVVNCRGNYFQPGAPGSQLVWINPVSLAIERSLPLGQYADDMELLPDALLVLCDSAVMRVSLEDFSLDTDYLPKSLITADPLDRLYSVVYDDLKGELYVSNGKYGGVNGNCVVFDPFLNPVRSFETGIYPGEIFFYR